MQGGQRRHGRDDGELALDETGGERFGLVLRLLQSQAELWRKTQARNRSQKRDRDKSFFFKLPPNNLMLNLF